MDRGDDRHLRVGDPLEDLVALAAAERLDVLAVLRGGEHLDVGAGDEVVGLARDQTTPARSGVLSSAANCSSIAASAAGAIGMTFSPGRSIGMTARRGDTSVGRA